MVINNITEDLVTINTCSEAKACLGFYGDFHDCRVEYLVQNFTKRRLEIHIENLFDGLVSDEISQSGVIVFEQVEYLVCQIPYVGGEVYISGIEVSEEEDGLKLDLDVTTTEWMDSEEFKTIQLVVKTQKMLVRKHLS